MNKCTERIYNGLVKENPTFVLMLGMCPTSGSYHIRHKRYRNGTFDYSRTDYVKHADFHTAEKSYRILSECRHLL